MFARVGILIVLLVGATLSAEADPWNAGSLDQSDPAFEIWASQGRLQGINSTPKKSCSEAYPVPEAAAHWTDCKEGQFSQCAGPDECKCDSPHERLVWHVCKEGSYARCQDDDTCLDSCRY